MRVNKDMEAFIQALPKVELHLHIEGTLEPAMMFELAKRNQVELPYENVNEIQAAYDFDSLQSFLNLYYAGSQVLLNQQDFFDLTWAYLKRCHAENVQHVEIFFDPQAHTDRGIAFSSVIEGIKAALSQAQAELGISYKLIMSFLRHLSEQSAFDTLEKALPYIDWIDGVGLDSAELGNPPVKFINVFAKCRELGLLTVAHAGEEGPAENIRNSIDLLKVSRIDHGVRIIEDTELLLECVTSRMPLTVCPLSNVKLCVFDSMAQHNILDLLALNLCVTVNSDDPAYFGGYMNANYEALVTDLGASKTQLKQLAVNSVKASWLDTMAKQSLIDEINELQ